jgi:hypothetical protein
VDNFTSSRLIFGVFLLKKKYIFFSSDLGDDLYLSLSWTADFFCSSVLYLNFPPVASCCKQSKTKDNYSEANDTFLTGTGQLIFIFNGKK